MFPFSVSSSLTGRSDSEVTDPNEIRSQVSMTIIGQYFSVAFITLLVYQSMITLDKEARFFWPNPRNYVSILFFTNRYVGLLAAIANIIFGLFTSSLASCMFSFWAANLANVITIVIIEYILLIRVLALFNQNEKLSITLKTLLGLEASIGMGIFMYVRWFEDLTVSNLAGMTVCSLKKDAPRTLSIVSWTIPIAYAFILLGLALYKAAEFWRASSGLRGFNFVRILIRDQAVYYAFAIFFGVCQVVNISIDENRPFVANLLGSAGSPTLLCILGSQLLMNLKEAGEKGANGGTENTSGTLSDMRFDDNGANNAQLSRHIDSA